MASTLMAPLAGCIASAGLLVVLKSARRQRQPLNELLRAANSVRVVQSNSMFHRGVDAIASNTTNSRRMQADLAVLSRTPQEFALTCVKMLATFASLPIFVAMLTSATGSTTWNPALIAVSAILFGLFGFVISKSTLASEAASRRRGFVSELAAYLDIVAQQLAGGAGVEDALWRSARNGRSPGIIAIRDALASARTSRRSEWVALGELAHRTSVAELAELVTAVQLAGTSGAKVSASLVAKAHALRDRNASLQLADAQRASERMGGPLIGMLLAFLVLIVAPALAAVMAI